MGVGRTVEVGLDHADGVIDPIAFAKGAEDIHVPCLRLDAVAPAKRSDSAMSAMERNRTMGSSPPAMKPRRRQKAEASASMALTTTARPPIRRAPRTQRRRA